MSYDANLVYAWEVVIPGGVNVRTSPDLRAGVVGRGKDTGEVVYGRRLGTWVALVEEPGYVCVTNGGTPFLRQVLLQGNTMPKPDPPKMQPPMLPLEPKGLQSVLLESSTMEASSASSVELPLKEQPSEPEVTHKVVCNIAGAPSSSCCDPATDLERWAESREPRAEEAAERALLEKAAPLSFRRELTRASLAAAVVVLLWAGLLLGLGLAYRDFDQSPCPAQRDAKSCEHCGTGTTFFPLLGEFERSWPMSVKIVLYFVGLLWLLQGLALLRDTFVTAIQEITSYSNPEWVDLQGGCRHKCQRKVWNSTVAHLTLVGSSAPVILLNLIETCSRGFFAGELGASTIVGSAAYNLLMVTAVCICVLPSNTTRRVEGTEVFAVTCAFSLFAYVWLAIIFLGISPERVERWEALVTLLLFPLLLVVSYMADSGWLSRVFRPGADTSPPARRESAWMQSSKVPKTFSKVRHGVPARVEKEADRASPIASPRGGQEETTFVGFESAEHRVFQHEGFVYLKVTLSHPSSQAVELQYRSHDLSEGVSRRYKKMEGSLTFEPGQVVKAIEVPIMNEDTWRDDESFTVELFNIEASPQAAAGGSFCSRSNNREVRLGLCIATVTVIAQKSDGTCCRQWRHQFVAAIFCNDSPEAQAAAHPGDWLLHGLALPWKVALAFLPPPRLCYGWCCFCLALLAIGFVTALVADIATLFGCSTGFHSDDWIGITVVAVGMNLPDTFISKMSAAHDDTADYVVANIMGTSSVNVFLGVGLPYTIAAFYWDATGVTPAWSQHTFSGQTFQELYMPRYPSGGFMVPATIGFRMALFAGISAGGLGLLLARRVIVGGELGGPGPAQVRDALMLTVLWVVFVVVAARESLKLVWA